MGANLSENQRLKAIILPVLARYFTEHKQQVEKWLEDKFAAFNTLNKKEMNALEGRLNIPVTDQPQLNLYISEVVPERAFGLNGEVLLKVNPATSLVETVWRKNDGIWTQQGAFPAGSVNTRTSTSWAADGVTTLFPIPNGANYAANTGILYYRGRHYGPTEWTITGTDLSFTPYGNPPKEDTSTSEDELQFYYETTP